MADIVKTVKNEMTFEKILAAAMHTPGVKINREKFLRKELIRYCSEDIIAEAIKNNPAKAGISKELVNKISKQVINYEEGHYFPGYKESGQCSLVPSAYAGFLAVRCSAPAIFLIAGYSEAMHRRCFPVVLSNKASRPACGSKPAY